MLSSVALIVSAMFSGVKPNWVRMKPGDRLSLTTRCMRVGDVLRGQRVAGVELDAGADLERHLQAVVGHAPALGDQALELADVVGRVGHQPVVDLGLDLGRRELEHLGRVEADHVVDEVGHAPGRPWASPPAAAPCPTASATSAAPRLSLNSLPIPHVLRCCTRLMAGQRPHAAPFCQAPQGLWGWQRAGSRARPLATRFACTGVAAAGQSVANRLLTSRATWHVGRHVGDQEPVELSTILAIGDVDHVTAGG